MNVRGDQEYFCNFGSDNEDSNHCYVYLPKIKIEQNIDLNDEVEEEQLLERPNFEHHSLHTDFNFVFKDVSSSTDDAPVKSAKNTDPLDSTAVKLKEQKKSNKRPNGDDLDSDTENSLFQTTKKKRWTMCDVPGCRAKAPHGKYYSLPKSCRNEEQRRLWIDAIQTAPPEYGVFTPTDDSFVCEEHFYGGKPSISRLDPDYAPAVFSWNDKRRPKTDKEIENFQKLKEVIQKKTDEIVSRKIKGISGDILEDYAFVIFHYGEFSPSFDVFALLAGESAEKEVTSDSFENTATPSKNDSIHAEMRTEFEKKLAYKDLEIRELKNKLYRLSQEKQEQMETIGKLEQNLLVTKQHEKSLIDKIKVLSKRQVVAEPSLLAFRGTQTTRKCRSRRGKGASKDDDEDDCVVMTADDWVKTLKKESQRRKANESKRRRRMEIRQLKAKRSELRSESLKNKNQKSNAKMESDLNLNENPSVDSHDSTISCEKKYSTTVEFGHHLMTLQPVDPLLVPDSVRLAVEFALKRKHSGNTSTLSEPQTTSLTIVDNIKSELPDTNDD